MSQGIPKFKASELVKRIESLTDSDIQNKFIINPIKNEIEALKKTNASQAYAVSGELTFILGDYDKGRSEYQKSFNLNKFDDVVLFNYAASLSRANFHHEAYEAYLNAYEVRKDKDSLMGLHLTSLASLQFSNLRKYTSQLVKMFPEDQEVSLKNENTKRLIDYFERHNISEDDGCKLSDIAWNTLIQHKISKSGFHVVHVPANDSIDFMIYLDKPVAEVAKLNMELALNLAEAEIADEVTDNVIISYMPFDDSLMDQKAS